MKGRVKAIRSFALVGGAVGLVAFVVWMAAYDPTLERRAKRVSRSEACAFISNNMETYTLRLRGATQAEAMALLPEPDNTNRADVLVWKNRGHVADEIAPGDWRRLVFPPGDGLMLVFVDGRPATPFLAISADWDPWSALMHFQNMTEEEAEKTLGPRPKH